MADNTGDFRRLQNVPEDFSTLNLLPVIKNGIVVGYGLVEMIKTMALFFLHRDEKLVNISNCSS